MLAVGCFSILCAVHDFKQHRRLFDIAAFLTDGQSFHVDDRWILLSYGTLLCLGLLALGAGLVLIRRKEGWPLLVVVWTGIALIDHAYSAYWLKGAPFRSHDSIRTPIPWLDRLQLSFLLAFDLFCCGLAVVLALQGSRKDERIRFGWTLGISIAAGAAVNVIEFWLWRRD